MHSDHNAKEPGSLVWQSEHKLICSDDHTVTLTHAFHAHRHSSRINQPYFSHPSASLTLVLLPSMGSLTQGSTYLGVPHMVYGHISDDLTASHPTSNTICSSGREQSPHPALNPGLNGMAVRAHTHVTYSCEVTA